LKKPHQGVYFSDVMENVKGVVEALLFSTDEPLSISKIHSVLGEATQEEIKNAINELKLEYDTHNHSFRLQEIAGGYLLLTLPEYKNWQEKLHKTEEDKKFSSAALETLAIIAYKQPIKRVDIEAIRGVQSSQIIQGLMEKKLVRIVGREDVPGAPILYGTTKFFLDMFGLRSIEDLPKTEEIK